VVSGRGILALDRYARTRHQEQPITKHKHAGAVVLSEALSDTFRGVKRVRLWALAAELEQKLPDGYVWISKGANVELARRSVQHVFISYVREDSADADKLAEQLRRSGVHV
jgi:hypothetical protein